MGHTSDNGTTNLDVSVIRVGARPEFYRIADWEKRVGLRGRPYQTFATPPRHLDANDQNGKLTHWHSSALAWDAADPS